MSEKGTIGIITQEQIEMVPKDHEFEVVVPKEGGNSPPYNHGKPYKVYGAINPITGKEWVYPSFFTNELKFLAPAWISVDIPPNLDNINDYSWFYRNFPHDPTESPGPDYRLELAVVEPVNVPKNESLMQRLSDCWKLRKSELESINNNVWSNLLEYNVKILNAILDPLDQDLAYKVFSHVHSTTLCEGLQQGFQGEFWLRNYPVCKTKYAQLIYDRILSMAEFLGLCPVECPEQGGPILFRMDLQELIKQFGPRIQGILHAKINTIRFPRIQGRLIGGQFTEGVIDERQLTALYVAIKIDRLVKGNLQAKICDLGAGNGLVIFWLYQFGYRNLWTVDLPHIKIGRAHV